MTTPHAQSSFADADWLPTLEMLVRGTHHTLNNRVAALDGVMSLQEMGLATWDETMQALRSEMDRLRELLNLLRGMTPKTITRREPERLGDALRVAAALLDHRSDARQVSVELGEEAADAEPVMLWPADGLRAMVLLLVAASDAATPATKLRATITGGDRRVSATVEGSITVGEVERSPAYQSLVRFAALESGSCGSEAGADGVGRVTLTLPGMSRAPAA
ncbi:MAG: hypothetical protein WD771_10660 [Gemmatimonadaceae bacterium]